MDRLHIQEQVVSAVPFYKKFHLLSVMFLVAVLDETHPALCVICIFNLMWFVLYLAQQSWVIRVYSRG